MIEEKIRAKRSSVATVVTNSKSQFLHQQDKDKNNIKLVLYMKGCSQ